METRYPKGATSSPSPLSSSASSTFIATNESHGNLQITDFQNCRMGESLSHEDTSMTSMRVDNNNVINEDFNDLMQFLDSDDGYNRDFEDALEPMRQKQEALYSDISAQHAMEPDHSMQYANSAFFDSDCADFVNNSESVFTSSVGQKNPHGLPIKVEDGWEDQLQIDPLAPGPSRSRDMLENADIPGSECEFNPKARKYNLKPEAVKKTLKYIDARKRNNIAVRKSRYKQKAIQAERDRQLQMYKEQNKKYETDLNKTHSRIAELEKKCHDLEVRYNQVLEENRQLHHALSSGSLRGQRCK